MTLLKPSEPWAVTAEGAGLRRGYAAKSELELRPQARIVHEIVMGEGRVRADVAALDHAHIAAFEIKGAHDDTTRLLHQVGMFQLCVPEVWIVAAENHDEDAKLIRHLLPSVGILIGSGMDRGWGRAADAPVQLRVEAEAVPRPPVPDMALRILWANEVRTALLAAGHPVSPKMSRPSALKILRSLLSDDELLPAICTQLRARDALWRADAPITVTA